MDTVTVSVAKLQDWQRLLRAMHGQVSENMRPCQGKADVLFTLGNMREGIERMLKDAEPQASGAQNTPNTGGWNEHSRYYGTE